MLHEIVFCGVDAVAHVRRSQDTVVISILDRSEAAGRPDLAGFGDALVLEFEDNFESEVEVDAGRFWPDEISGAEHSIYCGHEGEHVSTMNDARQIVAFIDRHHQSPYPVSLLVHCYAGVSRSAAVALWASTRFRVSIICNRTTDYANPRLLRLLSKVDCNGCR
jgi:predicted protein tyrosine phosphatase